MDQEVNRKLCVEIDFFHISPASAAGSPCIFGMFIMPLDKPPIPPWFRTSGLHGGECCR